MAEVVLVIVADFILGIKILASRNALSGLVCESVVLGSATTELCVSEPDFDPPNDQPNGRHRYQTYAACHGSRENKETACFVVRGVFNKFMFGSCTYGNIRSI